MENTKITDEKLYELCKKYGTASLSWRRKFVGLLPEVNRRKLYEKKGFSSVFEFAARLCGLSTEQVRLALNLEKRFEDKPVLKKMLEEGEVSINKLSRVVSIATVENQEELAEKVKILPARALETLVRDEKMIVKSALEDKKQNGFQKPLFGGRSLHVQTLETAKRSFQLAPDVTEQLNELHSKGIDINELLRKFLKQRKEEIEKKKEEIVKDIEGNGARGEQDSNVPSRYIPAKIKKIIKEEFGTKCSIPTCQKPAEIIHHTQTFGLSHTHDPRFLAPLCREHHAIAHSVDVKFHEMRTGSGNT